MTGQVSGVPISDGRLSKRPSFALASLVEPDSCKRFLDAFTWVLEEIKQCESGKKTVSPTNS